MGSNTQTPLAGRRIGVPESRQLDLFTDMLDRRGAQVTRCPLVDIRDTPEPVVVERWLDDVIETGLDDMIWLTGEGVRRLRGFAERASDQRLAAFTTRLAGARQITRGPKPVRELKKLGLRSDLPATRPTTAGVIEALADVDLAGRRVGVQLYGTDPNRPLMTCLATHQAIALPVAPYVYADEAEHAKVAAFIDTIIAGGLDALAFTSSPQVTRLFKVARQEEREQALIHAANRICIAAVGPLVAERLETAGVTVTLMPESGYFMKPLVRRIVDYFAELYTAPPRTT